MADIALVTANRINLVHPISQLTLPAGEAITAGMAVRIDTQTGKFTKANGTNAGEARVFGIAVKTVIAGESLTAIASGVMDGWDLSGLAYDAAVYLSDTDGRLEGTNAPTVDVPIGRVIPGWAVGSSADKLLWIDCTPYFAYNPSDPDRVLAVPIIAGEVSKHAFVADRAYKVKSISEIHSVVSTAANTLTIRKILAASASAPNAAAGANVKELMQAGLDLKAAVDVAQAGTLVAAAADLTFASGDKLALAVSAATTGLAGCVVTIVLTPV
jgi:hypothetical protein